MVLIFTIGHGSRSSQEFLEILKSAGIDLLADVRAHPASRRHPQFSRANLMRTPEFQIAVDGLIEQAGKTRTAIMCAERFPGECYRSLISDYLVARGIRVSHLIAPGETLEHQLSPLVRISNGMLVYDKTEQLDLGV